MKQSTVSTHEKPQKLFRWYSSRQIESCVEIRILDVDERAEKGKKQVHGGWLIKLPEGPKLADFKTLTTSSLN